jgi:hypothetical protein
MSRLIGPNFIVKSIVLAIIGLSLVIMLESLVRGSAQSQTGVTFDFFRIVEKPMSEKSEPLLSVTISERGRSFVIFTDRKPSFSIPVNEIISIAIEQEETRGLKGDYVYKATFSISKAQKKRLDDFASVNGQQPFDFRFGDKRLGRIQFVGRFGGVSETTNEFATFLEPRDSATVKEIFAPIKNKIIWK